MTETLRTASWLVQRLTRPRQVMGIDNPFAFGGGLKNGGLTDEAMGLLRGIFSFDYMGAAEFEFGAVPKALGAMATFDLAATTITIPLAEVAPDWRDKSKTRPTGEATVYLLCAVGQEAEVERRIREWAGERVNDLKEQTRLASALRPTEEWHSETCGWLELDNGFFFSTDRTMWEQTCKLFGVDPGKGEKRS